jgi:hypothetical protein
MKEEYPEYPDQGEHGEDLAFLRVSCLFDLVHLCNEAHDAQNRLQLIDGGSLLSRKFVIASAGNRKYDFPHMRLKLAPKNRRLGSLPIISPTLRFVGEGDETSVFIKWETKRGNVREFYLDQDSFFRLERNEDNGLTKQPTSWRDYEDLQILVHNFEPELQDNGSDAA